MGTSSLLMQELSKLNAYEEQFNTASQALGKKYGLPPITLDELPATMDSTKKHAISKKEVQWIIQKAKKDAEIIRRTDPKYADPYNSKEFKAEQKRVAGLFGMSDEQLEKAKQLKAS
jgi:hypothetical protein